MLVCGADPSVQRPVAWQPLRPRGHLRVLAGNGA